MGNWRRQRLREVLLEILRRAAAWPADAVLIAGDLFDLARLSRDTGTFLREAFELVRPIPVFIAPGNDDPFVPHSPYAMETWPANVTIFDHPEWAAVALPDVPLTVHGFGFDAPAPTVNPFGALAVPPDGRIHVAVAHGAERNHRPSDKEPVMPFDAAKAVVPGLAYFALGHYHAPLELPAEGETRLWYSGAPEGHGFHETGVHHYLEVEIEGDPAAPLRVKVTPADAARTAYVVCEVDCSGAATLEELAALLRAAASGPGKECVARVTLSGHCPTALKEQLGALHEAVADVFTFLDLIDVTEPAEEYAELSREHTSLGLFVRRTTEQIGLAAEERRRRMLLRAREVGMAAYRDRELALRSLEGNPR